MLNAKHLEQFIKEHQIQAELTLLEEKTPTVEASAKALNVAPQQIAKSILFMVDKKPVLIIASGKARISKKKLAKHFSIGRGKVKLARPDVVLQESGFQVGSMPPFGHQKALPTILEAQIKTQEVLYVGGGSDNAMIKITRVELEKSVPSQFIDLAEEKET